MAIFLFGMERSGTTLLSMIMGSHPDVAVPLSTTGMWYDFFNTIDSDYECISTEKSLKKLVDDICNHERIQLWDKKIDKDKTIQQCSVNDFSSVFNAFHCEYAQKCGKPIWANIDIKTLDNMHIANKWFPDAKFVHIVRDGRDVALSHQTMPFDSGNILECANAWTNRVGQNIKMGEMLQNNRYHLMTFEDLILKPEKTLHQLCEFLDIKYSENMLGYSKHVEKVIPENKLWLWPEIKNAPQKSKTFKWKTKMSKTQRVVFEWNAQSLLKELNYTTYDNIPKYPLAYLFELYCFLGKEHRFRRLQEKLGKKHVSKLESRANTGKKTGDNSNLQRKEFNRLVDEGVYSSRFNHSVQTKNFVDSVLNTATRKIKSQNMNILECGCGTGVWLQYLDSWLGKTDKKIKLTGFDVSERMVEVAKKLMKDSKHQVAIYQGNVLDRKSYLDTNMAQQYFDFIFIYDVIQQLPPERQFEACLLVKESLSKNGVAVIFDHDRDSIYGWKMGVKKYLTQRFGLPLVPKFYCRAKYPALNRIKNEINNLNDVKAYIVKSNDIPKKALVIAKTKH